MARARAPSWQVEGVTVDHATGEVFVDDAARGGRLYKFNASGEPANFTATATNSITGVGGAGAAEDEIAVDESSGRRRRRHLCGQ